MEETTLDATALRLSAGSILTSWAGALISNVVLWLPSHFLPLCFSPVSVVFSAWLLVVASVLNSGELIPQAHSPMLSPDPKSTLIWEDTGPAESIII